MADVTYTYGLILAQFVWIIIVGFIIISVILIYIARQLNKLTKQMDRITITASKNTE